MSHMSLINAISYTDYATTDPHFAAYLWYSGHAPSHVLCAKETVSRTLYRFYITDDDLSHLSTQWRGGKALVDAARFAAHSRVTHFLMRELRRRADPDFVILKSELASYIPSSSTHFFEKDLLQ